MTGSAISDLVCMEGDQPASCRRLRRHLTVAATLDPTGADDDARKRSFIQSSVVIMADHGKPGKPWSVHCPLLSFSPQRAHCAALRCANRPAKASHAQTLIAVDAGNLAAEAGIPFCCMDKARVYKVSLQEEATPSGPMLRSSFVFGSPTISNVMQPQLLSC